MLLPKVVVTAYLASQSQKTSIENHGSVQQIQSPLVNVIPHSEASTVGDYVIEINGQPIATDHVDVEIPHGPNVGESTKSAHQKASTPPHALENTYVDFDHWDTGKVDPSKSLDGAKLSGGYIYEFKDFPTLRNDYENKKFWGIPTEHAYTELGITLDSNKHSFSYNIGYILDGNLTAATFDVWYKDSERPRFKLNVDTTWLNNPWKENTVNHVNEIYIVLSGFYTRRGILAFYDWGYQD